jgi:O-antigen/teichoic acid export membrane protein
MQAYVTVAVLAAAYAILAANVVPHNALLGLGNVRFVSTVNILGGVLSLVAATSLIPVFGILGAAIGRLLYGPAIALNFLKIRSAFSRNPSVARNAVLIST